MMSQKMLDALSSTIYAAKLSLRGETVDDDDKRIRASGLYEEWKEGTHTVGEIYNANGQTWECYQAYDNGIYPDIVPGTAAWFTFNRPLHGKTPETARPWVQPTHSMDIYKKGECMIWTDGVTYRCIAPNGTDYSPDVYPAFWEVAV